MILKYTHIEMSDDGCTARPRSARIQNKGARRRVRRLAARHEMVRVLDTNGRALLVGDEFGGCTDQRCACVNKWDRREYGSWSQVCDGQLLRRGVR